MLDIKIENTKLIIDLHSFTRENSTIRATDSRLLEDISCSYKVSVTVEKVIKKELINLKKPRR